MAQKLFPSVTHHVLIAILGAFALLSPVFPVAALAEATSTVDALPSWNDGAAKKAIVDFVKATTDQSSPEFVPTRGTHRHLRPGRHVVGRASDVQSGGLLPGSGTGAGEGQAGTRQCRAIQDRDVRRPRGDGQAVHAGSRKDLVRHAHRHDGGCFQRAKPRNGLRPPRTTRWKRPYTELTYQPMHEVLSYLRANGFKTYIVTGGGQDFVRVYSERVYGIPPEQVVGTAAGHDLQLRRGWKADPDQGPEAFAQRQRRGQAGGHSPDDRAQALCRVRQLDRRSADARVYWSRRRRCG